MSLFKVRVTYTTRTGDGASATLVLAAATEAEAGDAARAAVNACSQAGVREFRSAVVTRNSMGVEFLGRQPA